MQRLYLCIALFDSVSGATLEGAPKKLLPLAKINITINVNKVFDTEECMEPRECAFCEHADVHHKVYDDLTHSICNQCAGATRWHSFVTKESTCCDLRCKLYVHYHADNESYEDLYSPNDRPCYPWRSPDGQACTTETQLCIWHNAFGKWVKKSNDEEVHEKPVSMHFEIEDLIELYPFYGRLHIAAVGKQQGASVTDVQEFVLSEHSNASEFLEAHLNTGHYRNSAEAQEYMLAVIDAELKNLYGLEYDRDEAARKEAAESGFSTNKPEDRSEFIAREYRRIQAVIDKQSGISSN